MKPFFQLRTYFTLGLLLLAGLPVGLLLGFFFFFGDISSRAQTFSPSLFVILFFSMILGGVFIGIGLVRAWREKGEKESQQKQREMEILGTSLHGVINRLQEDERESREKAFFAEKMAAVGEMSSGLAHEMNNVLMPIQGYAKMLKEKATGADREKLEIIHQNASYGVDIVKNMLAFARTTKQTIVSFNIVQTIYAAEKLLHFQVQKKGIDLILPPFNLEYHIEADENQIKQVLINLILNAIHAVDQGGRIEIDVQEEGHCVKISIKDNGCGMDPETLSQIFKPFITKRQGGVGLGLAVTYSIIQFHGGDINVTSELGMGTTLTLTLPMYRM